ncbi:hypothetical protein SASPL_118416 [Salvia splendens]|uniref:Uncharacterized protein n=1 Tax=Salvia splendens TaxID=180675 RepID=A0A8X8ZYF3_SALSN|nr:uncharacterized protein LOC121809250 [Salvia splendens]KAG6421857.1 hypothetical protein SASPL_118416 [Salvia splendens]
MSLVTDAIRAAASEMYHGDDICREKSKQLLTEMGLPNGLLPLKDIVEVGYVKETGFVWLIQKKKCEHRFEKIGKPVQYATEVTAYIQPNRITKLTGVKAKELLLWVVLREIYVDVPPTGKITFKTPTGLFRTYPVDAFQLQDDNNNNKNENANEKEKEKKPAVEIKPTVEVKEV